eukprot:GHVQ01042858.1.p1 GENE.GHVQ01042858.1~~GHVQ01042858.1.p1  ORF type:complete len:448 (+),score=119.85 GHVQ01042858.1:214-1557(+)
MLFSYSSTNRTHHTNHNEHLSVLRSVVPWSLLLLCAVVLHIISLLQLLSSSPTRMFALVTFVDAVVDAVDAVEAVDDIGEKCGGGAEVQSVGGSEGNGGWTNADGVGGEGVGCTDRPVPGRLFDSVIDRITDKECWREGREFVVCCDPRYGPRGNGECWKKSKGGDSATTSSNSVPEGSEADSATFVSSSSSSSWPFLSSFPSSLSSAVCYPLPQFNAFSSSSSVPLSAASLKALFKIKTNLYTPIQLPPPSTTPNPSSFAALSNTTTNSSSSSSTTNSRSSSKKKAIIPLDKKRARSIQGNLRRYQLIGDRPEFHNIDRNRHGHIFEPTDTFQIKITSSINNIHISLLNKSQNYRCIFSSFAGNVGIRKAARKRPATAYRVAENVARKCKRLGVRYVHVKFRRLQKVDMCIKAMHVHGVSILSLTHEPRLPKSCPFASKARQRRKV